MFHQGQRPMITVTDPEIYMRADDVAATSFIANNELYVFYTGKSDLLKKKSETNRGGAPPLLEPATRLAICTAW